MIMSSAPVPIEANASDAWPALPLDGWRDTYATLQLWSQVVGKVRLARTPPLNHWWHVPLYVTARGLTTSPIPHPPHAFQIDFDFIDHRLVVEVSNGESRSLALEPRTVADFHRELMACLRELGIGVEIWTMPQEVQAPIPFERDEVHAAYAPEPAHRHWRILLQADRLLNEFRSDFLGKSSPVHFFWGSFDLAMTRFSGRRAPRHPGGIPGMADRVVHEAYSHEVASFGFWPGEGPLGEPAFYAYAYPEPEGFADAAVQPDMAYYHPELREFVLPYEAVRTVADPDGALLAFFRSAYEAAADLGGWDRASLERGGVRGEGRSAGG